MKKGTTTSGFDFELDDNVLDDYELLEALCDIDNGDYGKLPAMVRSLLGAEQTKALKDHIRSQGGRVSAKALIAEVGEILTLSGPGKNS